MSLGLAVSLRKWWHRTLLSRRGRRISSPKSAPNQIQSQRGVLCESWHSMAGTELPSRGVGLIRLYFRAPT